MSIAVHSETGEGRRTLVLAACMAATAMAAVEATIVATAMPAIVADLGGFSLFGWVFAAYLLTQAVSIPIYGRLADLYGRKRMFAIGALVFLAGSTLCGFAPTMLMLVIFRTIQGIGAGAIIPIAQTIIGDVYSPAERAKIQGWLSSVWGVSAVVGPLLGAVIVDHVGWPLVFWVNLPIGATAMAMLAAFFREHARPQVRSVDYLGTFLLVLAATLLMLALLQAELLGWWIVALLAVAAAALVLLAVQERVAPEPLLPPFLWRDPTVIAGNLGGLAIGAVVMSVSAFLPTYIEGVMGLGNFAAGAVIAALSLGWPVTSTLSARVMLVTSYRTTALAGAVFLLVGSAMLVLLTPARGAVWAGVSALLVGGGMGFCSTTFLVSVQNAVGRHLRGIATSSTVFTRQLGSALGTALLGAVLNVGLGARLRMAGDPVRALMEPSRRAALSAQEIAHLTGAVAGALHGVFWATLAIALAALLASWLMPRGLRPDRGR